MSLLLDVSVCSVCVRLMYICVLCVCTVLRCRQRYWPCDFRTYVTLRSASTRRVCVYVYIYVYIYIYMCVCVVVVVVVVVVV